MMIGILLLIMPWVFIPDPRISSQFRIPQMAVMATIFMAIISVGLYKGTRLPYRNKILAVFMGYVFLRVLTWVYIPLAFQTQIAPFVIMPIMNILLGMLATLMALAILTNEDYIKIAKFLCVSASAVAVFGILQYIGLDPLRSIAKYHCANRMSACLDNPNLVGNYLALISPLFLYFKKPQYLVGYVIAGLCVWLSASHTAQACFVIALYVSALIHFRKSPTMRIVLFALPAVLILFPIRYLMKVDTGFDGRLYCWQNAIQIVKHNVLFGSGIGIFQAFRMETLGASGVGNVIWFEAHCDYLQYLVEMGLVGVGLFVALVCNIFRKFNYASQIGGAYFAMFVTFLFMMVPSFPCEVPSLAILGLLGFWAVENNTNGGSHD